MTAFERIREVICEELGARPEDVTPETALGELDADSLEIAALVITLEDTLAVELSEEKWSRVSKVKDLVRLAQSGS